MVLHRAGASSLLHHLVWTSSNSANETSPAPFNRAIIQSPAFLPIPGSSLGRSFQDETFHTLAQATAKCANVTSTSVLTCLKEVDETTIADANHRLVHVSQQGIFTYGPIVDDNAIPDLPMNLLEEGRFNKNVTVMTSTVGAEGVIFVPIREIWQFPDFSEEGVEGHISAVLPIAGGAAINHILETYPYDNATIMEYGGLYFPLISPQTRRLAYFAGKATVVILSFLLYSYIVINTHYGLVLIPVYRRDICAMQRSLP